LSYSLGVLMDPPKTINPAKDSTLAIMNAAQNRGWEISIFTQKDLYLENGTLWISNDLVNLREKKSEWYSISDSRISSSMEFDAILMRKDPPFNMDYIYSTYLLEFAEKLGTPVLNRPRSIRDCNEKLFALEFPNCCPPHIVSSNQKHLRSFYEKHQDVVFKPLDGMGGQSIFRAKPQEHNLSVILENLTEDGRVQIIGQEFIPEIAKGDTRIILINGTPIPYGLARVPSSGETRGNLAAGGKGVGRDLTERDFFICNELGDALREKGLFFVGIDVIGDFLTEINVTCPTCIIELNEWFSIDIGSDYMKFIEKEILAD